MESTSQGPHIYRYFPVARKCLTPNSHSSLLTSSLTFISARKRYINQEHRTQTRSAQEHSGFHITDVFSKGIRDCTGRNEATINNHEYSYAIEEHVIRQSSEDVQGGGDCGPAEATGDPRSRPAGGEGWRNLDQSQGVWRLP